MWWTQENEEMCQTPKNSKLKWGFSTNVCENIVGKIHEALSRQSYLQSLQSVLSLLSFPFPPKYSLSDPRNLSQPVFLPLILTYLSPPPSLHLKTPFFFLLPLSFLSLLIAHLSIHLSILTKAAAVSEWVCLCVREWISIWPCCVLYALYIWQTAGALRSRCPALMKCLSWTKNGIHHILESFLTKSVVECFVGSYSWL